MTAEGKDEYDIKKQVGLIAVKWCTTNIFVF